MANPVLVEVTRGPMVECRHRGAVAVCDGSGAVVFSAGNADAPVYPRSAVKAIQALPLVESGAADAFGFSNREIALAQSSHKGEPGHVDCAIAMLRAAGLSTADLECGPQWPSHRPSGNILVTEGRMPGPEHNNCSGKHAGFLCFAVHSGMPTKGYIEPQHPVQQAVRTAMQELTGVAHNPDQCGRDGCSIPTYAVPLTALASAFARFGIAEGLPSDRRVAARQIFQAAVAEPWYVDGIGSFTTEALTALGGAALVKTGAEGVFCGAIPALGLGIALKCDDGSKHGSEAMMAEVLCRLLPDLADTIAHLRTIPIKTRRGREVGIIRPVAGEFEQLNVGVNADD